MKRTIEILIIWILIIANLLLLFRKQLGIALSAPVEGSVHIMILLCLGIYIYLNQNMSKKAKNILMAILVISCIIAFITIFP